MMQLNKIKVDAAVTKLNKIEIKTKQEYFLNIKGN